LPLDKQKMNWVDKLKQRWGVNSAWDVIVILIVFACTGFTIVYIKRLFGIDYETPLTSRVLFYVFVLLIYQVVLLVYGFLFGKFKFFYNFEKRMFKRIASLFVKKK
jgi:p-aminobenzoyl-glutamate transporter AbgT